ncbi:MAG: lipoyl(octanoyl) transferase LipB [Rickettsiaceae bacterium]|nr:lipoyl(octanoyl) transferase LipB [Rickettsiaceae bacterium]
MLNWEIIPGPSRYLSVIEQMDELLNKVILDISKDIVILTEHEHIITGGSGIRDEEIPANLNILKVGRGGKLTYHGPGQRIIYPIINLNKKPWNRDLKKYLTFLHNWIIATLNEFGINGHTREDHPGIWVYNPETACDAKIAAIGVRVKKWVTYHGISVNLHTDLRRYKDFIPCGIQNLGVTSALECKKPIEFNRFDEALKKYYKIEIEKVSL